MFQPDEYFTFQVWTKIIPNSEGSEDFRASLARNSSLVGEPLAAWIDSIQSQGWKIEGICSLKSENPEISDLCSNQEWSSFYPDPKSELTPVKADGRIR